MAQGSGGPGGPGTARPPAVAAAAVLVALEGVVVSTYALYLAVRALVDDPVESVAGVELGALLALGLGVVLLAAARALARLRPWARGPVATVQLLTLLIGLPFLRTPSPGPVAGAVAVAVSAAVLVLLFGPASRAAFEGPRG